MLDSIDGKVKRRFNEKGNYHYGFYIHKYYAMMILCNHRPYKWGQKWGQLYDRVLSSLILLGFQSYPDFDPRLALLFMPKSGNIE